MVIYRLVAFLRWSQRYTKTDMVYAAKGSFWILFGKTGAFFVSLITMAAFARWLPQEAYGTYQFIIAALGIVGIFSLSGINTALVRSIAQNKEGTLTLAIKEKTKWSLLGSALLLLAAGWYLFNGNTLLATGFFIASLFAPIRETVAISPIFWNGKKKFHKESTYHILPAILSLCLIVPVIYFTNNVLIVLFVSLAAPTLFEGIFLLKTVKQLQNKEQDKEVLSFSKNMTIMDATVRIAGHIDKVILWQFLGPAQVAIYSFAQLPIKSLGSVIPIHSLALPKLGEKNIKEIKKGLLSKFYLLFLISVPFTLSIFFITPFAYQMFFPRYIESIPYFQTLSLTMLFLPFYLLSAALISDLRKKELYIIRVGTSILRIILFLALVPFFGIWGVVSAFLIAETIRQGLILYYFSKI